MKVKMTTCMAGLDFVRNVGDVVDVDDAEGARMLLAGFAVPWRGREAETATVDPTGEIATAEPGVGKKPTKPKKPK